MLPTTGDLAPARPDRAEPPAAATPPPAGVGEAAEQPQGCLYALSQPPLMLFLCVVGGLIGGGAVYDLLVL